jgi:hypothetical protein
MDGLTEHGKTGKPNSPNEEGQPDFLTTKYPDDANSELFTNPGLHGPCTHK